MNFFTVLHEFCMFSGEFMLFLKVSHVFLFDFLEKCRFFIWIVFKLSCSLIFLGFACAWVLSLFFLCYWTSMITFNLCFVRYSDIFGFVWWEFPHFLFYFMSMFILFVPIFKLFTLWCLIFLEDSYVLLWISNECMYVNFLKDFIC